MLAVPAPVWRWGTAGRGVILGIGSGLLFGGLAWLDSGAVVPAAAAMIAGGGLFGTVTARRMAHLWPEASALAAGDRVTVARAVRHGDPISDPRLAAPALGYARGLHAAARIHPRWRWILAGVLVVSLATALWDARYGSRGSAVASALYLAALLAEVFWWPRRSADLLDRADRSVRGISTGL